MAVWIIGISSPLWEISLSSWGSKRRLQAIPKNCRWWGLLYEVCKTEWNANPNPPPFSNILMAPVFQLFNFWMEFFAEACKTDSKELTSSSFPVSSPSLRPSSTHTDRLYDHCKTSSPTNPDPVPIVDRSWFRSPPKCWCQAMSRSTGTRRRRRWGCGTSTRSPSAPRITTGHSRPPP